VNNAEAAVTEKNVKLLTTDGKLDITKKVDSYPKTKCTIMLSFMVFSTHIIMRVVQD
jgi:hypothetical protein